MATILRVKRKNIDSPMEMLMLACKRQRTDSFSIENESPTQAVVQFAGTLTDSTEDVAQHIAKILPKMDMEKVRTGVKRTYEEDFSCVSENIHKWRTEDRSRKRYQVVNCQHSQDTSAQTSQDKSMTIIDAVDFKSVSNSESDQKEDEEDVKSYVYDLYYVPNQDGISFENGEIFIHEPEYLVCDDDDDDESDDDTSDSNAESNWRNDYPDSDPDGSFANEECDYSSEDDMRNISDNCYVDEFYCEEEEYENKLKYGHVSKLVTKMRLFGSKSISDSSDDKKESSDNESSSESSDSQLL